MEFSVKAMERLRKDFFLFFFGEGRGKRMWEEFHWVKFVLSLFTNDTFPS